MELSPFSDTCPYKQLYGHDGVLDHIILLTFPTWFQMYVSIV